MIIFYFVDKLKLSGSKQCYRWQWLMATPGKYYFTLIHHGVVMLFTFSRFSSRCILILILY